MKKIRKEKVAAKSGRLKIAWDREREPSGEYNHIGYVIGNADGRSLSPEYWIFNFGDHYRADYFPYVGQREHIGDAERLPRARKLCRRHLKGRLKALKLAAKREGKGKR